MRFVGIVDGGRAPGGYADSLVRTTVAPSTTRRAGQRQRMSVYRVTEVIGVSTESWEAAARTAIETAAGSVRELRIAEVIRQDVTIENGQVTGFRVRLAISFKYDTES